MNNFSSTGLDNSSITPSLPSPQQQPLPHFKTETYHMLPSSRSDDMLGMDVKPMDVKIDVKPFPPGNGMESSPDWHHTSTGLMQPINILGSNNIPLPASSSSPTGTYQHIPPPGSISGTTESSASSLPPLCAGCRLRIVDKFYLSAVEAKWHTACLKCAECGGELENQSSCFEKDGQIYCKDDYLR